MSDGISARPPTSGGGNLGYHRRPTTAFDAAALLTALTPLIVASDSTAFHAELSKLSSLWHQATRRSGHDAELIRRLPDALERHFLPTYPHFRVAQAPKAARKIELGDNCDVPELLDPTTYAALTIHLPGTAAATGRAFASLCIARHCGARSWSQAGEWTGLGERSVRLADVVGRRITNVPGWWSAVADASTRLSRMRQSDPSPFTYLERRTALADLLIVSPSDLADPARVAFQPWTDARRRQAAVWIWANYAGGDPRTSPAMRCEFWNARPDSRRDGWTRFAAALPDNTAAALLQLAAWRVESHLTRKANSDA